MLWICTACTTAYSVGAPKCPHCGGRDYVEQGTPEHEAFLAAAAKPVGKPHTAVKADPPAAGAGVAITREEPDHA